MSSQILKNYSVNKLEQKYKDKNFRDTKNSDKHQFSLKQKMFAVNNFSS